MRRFCFIKILFARLFQNASNKVHLIFQVSQQLLEHVMGPSERGFEGVGEKVGDVEMPLLQKKYFF